MSVERMSFRDIVRTYQQPLYWYIRKVVLIHEDAEDILQETFLRAYRHFWHMRNPASIKAWLYKIATNETMRYFSRRAVAVQSLEDIGAMLAEGTAEAAEAPSPCKAEHIVSAALLRMSPLQRQVFCLRYYEDMSYDDISRITGSAKNTLMVSYHEARKLVENEIKR